MIHLSEKYRYLVYDGDTDMRKSFQGLAAIVKYHMHCNALSGDIYIFFNRRRNAIKLLRFEGDGFAIFYKHLEKGTFEMPVFNKQSGSFLVTDNELLFILKGVSLGKVKYRPRYTHSMEKSST